MCTHNDCVDHDEPQDAVGAEVAPERLLYEAVPVCIRVGFLALQAFLVMDGPVHARVSTTKFVKIPKGGEKDFRMAVKVVKDLREGTEPISATLKATKVTTTEWYEVKTSYNVAICLG